MANKVDDKINEIINDHAAESEKLSISRDVDETGRRIKAALEGFSRLDILASDHWGGLYYEQKITALREAVLELAKGAAKPAKSKQEQIDDLEAQKAIVEAEIATKEAVATAKKARKAKAAA